MPLSCSEVKDRRKDKNNRSGSADKKQIHNVETRNSDLCSFFLYKEQTAAGLSLDEESLYDLWHQAA